MAKVSAPSGATINDSVLIHWMSKLIGARAAVGDIREWFDMVDAADRLTVPVGRLRTVNERLPIRQMVLDKGPRSALYRYAEDASGGMLLVSDSILSGPDSLHFVRLSGAGELTAWVSQMTDVEVLACQNSGGILMAAPVRSFIAREHS